MPKLLSDHVMQTLSLVVRMRKAQRTAAREQTPEAIRQASGLEADVDSMLLQLVQTNFKREPGYMDVPSGQGPTPSDSAG